MATKKIMGKADLYVGGKHVGKVEQVEMQCDCAKTPPLPTEFTVTFESCEVICDHAQQLIDEGLERQRKADAIGDAIGDACCRDLERLAAPSA